MSSAGDDVTDIQTNAAAFSRALMDLSDEIDGSIEAVIRKACFDLYARIVKRTPVDTGRAKASWGIGTEHSGAVAPEGEHSVTELHNFAPSDISSAVISSTTGLFTFSINDDQVVIYNNLEYIEALESGQGSDQAPSGMVAISLAEFEAHFREALKTQKVFI